MQIGPSKGGKGGDANGSPTHMEQGGTAQHFMPHTLGAYDESLYRTAGQQNPPVPPSTPSSGSRQQAQGGVSAGSPGKGAGGCSGGGQGLNPSGLGPGLIGQIPNMSVAGGGFMSQWQTGHA